MYPVPNSYETFKTIITKMTMKIESLFFNNPKFIRVSTQKDSVRPKLKRTITTLNEEVRSVYMPQGF